MPYHFCCLCLVPGEVSLSGRLFGVLDLAQKTTYAHSCNLNITNFIIPAENVSEEGYVMEVSGQLLHLHW